MAIIAGALKYDEARTAVSSPFLPGIPNIPIVLQNTATYEMLAVYTDSNGGYCFINVPRGDYRIVEAYGTPAVASPGNFTNAVTGRLAVAVFPPIGSVTNPPEWATNLDSTTRNTLLLTVTGEDLAGQDILNGPYSSILRSDPAVLTPDSRALREEAINKIIYSIAREDMGLSQVLNAESEKLRYVLKGLPGACGSHSIIEQVLQVNDSVQQTLRTAVQIQRLLYRKLAKVLKSSEKDGSDDPPGPENHRG